MLRTWFYQLISTHAPLVAVLGDRMYQSTSVTEVPKTKPFLMYRFGVEEPRMRGDDTTTAVGQSVQIFFHDVPGDYSQIDSLMVLAKRLVEGATGPNLWVTDWIDSSEDFRDDELGTIFRYVRFRINYRQEA